MSDNKPSELELLRRVASAAEWVIKSNGEDVVGRDGRARVGLLWTIANGQLNGELRRLRELYGIEDQHAAERADAESLKASLARKS